MNRLRPGELRIGSWVISEDSPPVPYWVFSAVHDDYDGPGDDRHEHVHRLATGGVRERLLTLRDLIDVLIERDDVIDDEEEERSPCCRAPVHLVRDQAWLCSECEGVV